MINDLTGRIETLRDMRIDQPAADHILHTGRRIGGDTDDAQRRTGRLPGHDSTAINPPRKQISTPMAIPKRIMLSMLSHNEFPPNRKSARATLFNTPNNRAG